MAADRAGSPAPLTALAALALILAWLTLLGVGVIITLRVGTDWGDQGGWGLVYLLVLLAPAAALALRWLRRAGLSGRARSFAGIAAVGYALVATLFAVLGVFEITVAFALVAAACWRFGRVREPAL